MVNYHLIKLYHELFEMQHLLDNEILPLASQVGLDREDSQLIESAENFTRELKRHLSEYEASLSKNNPMKTLKRQK